MSPRLAARDVTPGMLLDLGRAGSAYVERVDTRADGRLVVRWRRRQRVYPDGRPLETGVMLGSLSPRPPDADVRVIDLDPEPGPDD